MARERNRHEKIHLREQGKDTPYYECGVCGNCLTEPHNLKRHLKKKHRDASASSPSPELRLERKGEFRYVGWLA